MYVHDQETWKSNFVIDSELDSSTVFLSKLYLVLVLAKPESTANVTI